MARVARSPYLSAIVGYVLCTACGATFMYLAQQRIQELPATVMKDGLVRADTLTARHLQRSLPGSAVVVLTRNNSENRLDAATATRTHLGIAPEPAAACPATVPLRNRRCTVPSIAATAASARASCRVSR